ncbi:TIGR02587 family membrane protein [Nafulsella turpanensis]|uniref:TIGR02587 family membrane protein n=1 Tax=Nafulsella turpanensis TaxID=1265690 RepID=UPI00034C6A77|nr:TIGR02587 family membrane protein [Nafulsella turpanensis]
MASEHDAKPIKDTLQEYGKGVAGGLLFSFPLLYTMEVWWRGFTASPFALLLLVLVTFFLLIAYNRYAGLRADASWHEIIIDSVEEMGIGFTLSFAVLAMLNRIQLTEMSVEEVLGKVVIEAMAVSIGVSIGTAQMGIEERSGKHEDEEVNEKRSAKAHVAVLALCGSLIVGGNVAPTEEITTIAVEASPADILVIALVSIFISAMVAYFINSRREERAKRSDFVFHLVFDTCMSYSIALVVSAFVLWFFGHFGGVGTWLIFAKVIALGLLSSLGASAGRLLIK